MDWKDLLGLPLEKPLGLFTVCLRALIIFAASLAMVRIAHKRFFAKKNAFDVMLTFLLASMLARPINDTCPLLATIAAGFLLIFLHRVLYALELRHPVLGGLLKGHDCEIIRHGKLLSDVLNKHALSHHDVAEQLRLKGVAEISAVESAVLERSGEISVIRRREP
jgi:uncharacterized membrane protein YcaP (DUF421 family)